jgi:hypothetical protein
MSEIKGYEARRIAEDGDGEVRDYLWDVTYMVVGSDLADSENAAYGGRPRTLEAAIEHRDRLITEHPDHAARYEVWEIVELAHIIQHRVVDTKVLTGP